MTLYLLARFFAFDPAGAFGVIAKLAIGSSPVIDAAGLALLVPLLVL